MKLQQKLLALLMVVVMLASVFTTMPVNATDAQGITITASASEVDANGVVVVSVYFSGTNLKSLMFAQEFDTDVFEPVRGRWVIDPDKELPEGYLEELAILRKGWVAVDEEKIPAIAFDKEVTLDNEKLFEIELKVIDDSFVAGQQSIVSFPYVAFALIDSDSKDEIVYNDDKNPELIEVSNGVIHAYCSHSNTTNVDEQAATCVSGGYTAGVWCDDCSRYLSGHEETPIDGNNHRWNDGEITTDPTATTPGVKTYTCLDCSETKTEPVDPVVTIMYGDINGDGKVNPADRALFSRYLAKWPGYGEDKVNFAAADLNCDGKVNPADRAILSRYLAKWPGYTEIPIKKQN